MVRVNPVRGWKSVSLVGVGLAQTTSHVDVAVVQVNLYAFGEVQVNVGGVAFAIETQQLLKPDRGEQLCWVAPDPVVQEGGVPAQGFVAPQLQPNLLLAWLAITSIHCRAKLTAWTSLPELDVNR